MRNAGRGGSHWATGALCLVLSAVPLRAQPAPPPPAPPAARISAGPDGLTITSADAQHQLRLRGYVHFDARLSETDPPFAETSTFLMRRVRPVFEATMFQRFQARVMPDFGEGRATLQDAYLEARFGPLMRVRFGKYKSPFGLERLMSATELIFAERAMPSLLAPNRDVGIMLHGQWAGERWSYALAFSNGVPDGASGDTDTRAGKDVVARVFVRPFAPGTAGLGGLGLGVAGSAGREDGTAGEPALPVFRSPAQQVFFRFRADGTPAGTAIARGARRRASLQASWYAGRVGAIAERTHSRQELGIGVQSGEVTATAWSVSGGMVLTGERATARGVSPRRPFEPASGQWGALEITVRLSTLAIAEDVFPRFADPSSAPRASREWAVGANWYLNRVVKLSGSFHSTTFEGGAPGGDRAPERLVLTRMQFAL